MISVGGGYNTLMDENLNLAGNTEIEKALEEFEVKNPEQAQKAPEVSAVAQKKVEGITFDTDTQVESYKAIKFYNETVEPKMVKAVIKLSGGTVKNQRQAEYILLATVILMIAVSLYLVMGVVVVKPKPPVPSITGVPIQQTSQTQLP